VPRFLIPVEGLQLQSPWRVGPVVLPDPLSVEVLVRSRLDLSPGPRAGFHQETFDLLRRWSAAEVDANDLDGAVAVVRDGLDLLRVFQQTRSNGDPPTFGLPGDVRLTHLRYLRLDATGGVGFSHTGGVIGADFPDGEREHWVAARFAEAAELVGCADLSPGPAQLMLGVRLLSQAVLEPRPPMRLLATVIATETLLGRGKMYQLARRAAFLTCGRPEGNLCGRARPACPFLTLDPTNERDRGRLKTREIQARADPGARCSEWLDFVGRYDDRSGIAHGEPGRDVPEQDADSDLHWATHWLLPAALPWLLDHRGDAVGDLDIAISQLPAADLGNS
jgi:hypothetical protein